MKYIAVALSIVLSTPAFAATWCARNDFLKNCWYFSLSACKEAIKDKDDNWYCEKQ